MPYRRNFPTWTSSFCLLIPLSFATPNTGISAPEDWPHITSEIQKDPAIEQQVQGMLARMSLDEKIGQMVQAEIQEVSPAEVREYHLGSVLSGGGSYPHANKYANVEDWLRLADQYWDASMDESDGKVAIPIIWGIDAVHGHSNVIGATLFPHNIGLGAARDPQLLYKIGRVTAREVLATGIDWTFGPTLAVVRDDRWGRSYEGYTEFAAFSADYAYAIVRGLQGRLREQNILATAKHFLGDGGTQNGDDQGNTILSESDLLTIHANGYFGAIKAGVQTIMVSFSSWNGKKIHGSKYLINEILKNRMGFDGLVVSDWNGIGQVEGCNNGSCAQAVNAGIDLFMIPYRSDWKAFIANTKSQVLAGQIPLTRINDAVRRILRVKLRMGALTTKRPSSRPLAGSSELLGAPEHRDVAREAVRKSLVLLKNNAHLLPLKRDLRVFVAGKSANSPANQNGGWTITWQGTGNLPSDYRGTTTILSGIQQAASQVTYSANGQGANPQAHDVAIVVIGETPYAEGYGDIDTDATLEHARLYPEDLEVLKRVHSQGVPIVTVFVSGRPLYTNKEINLSQSFVAAWLPGSEGGGIADVLFQKSGGGVNFDFTGRLSFSWPKEPCQVPLNVATVGYDPLFPYDYGLSYDHSINVPVLPTPTQSQGCGE